MDGIVAKIKEGIGINDCKQKILERRTKPELKTLEGSGKEGSWVKRGE